MTTKSQSPAVVKLNMFNKRVIRLWLRRFRLERDSNSVHSISVYIGSSPREGEKEVTADR